MHLIRLKIFRQKNRGYTLVELLLYTVVALIVTGFALSLIRTTSKSYTQDRRKSRMQTEGRNAVAMMAREMVNTGFKNYLRNNAGVFTLVTIPQTTMNAVFGTANPDGLSSFRFVNQTASQYYDQLEIIKAKLDASGQNPVQERIRFYNSGMTLMRGLRTYNSGTGAWSAETSVEIATNVEALQFQFSTDMSLSDASWVNIAAGVQKDVVAMRIHLLIRTSQAVDARVQKSYTLADVTLSPPTSDRYLRRLYTETVEVVNNGL